MTYSPSKGPISKYYHVGGLGFQHTNIQFIIERKRKRGRVFSLRDLNNQRGWNLHNIFWDGKESQLERSIGIIWEKWEISLTVLCGVNLWSIQFVKKQSFHPCSWSWFSFALTSTLFFMMLTTPFVKEHLPSLQWFLPSLNIYPLPMHMNGLILGAMFVQCGSILMAVDCSCRWLILARTEMPI